MKLDRLSGPTGITDPGIAKKFESSKSLLVALGGAISGMALSMLFLPGASADPISVLESNKKIAQKEITSEERFNSLYTLVTGIFFAASAWKLVSNCSCQNSCQFIVATALFIPGFFSMLAIPTVYIRLS